MQKAAIKTCNELHGKGAGNDRLECLWVEGGVGNDGSKVAIPDESVDVVVISETHIAEADIGPEEKVRDEIGRSGSERERGEQTEQRFIIIVVVVVHE